MKIGFVKLKLNCKYDINVIMRNISLNNIKGEIKIKLHLIKIFYPMLVKIICNLIFILGKNQMDFS